MNTMSVAKSLPRNYGNLLLGSGDEMESLKVLEANLAHVQRDATEIKGDQRRANEKLDGMYDRLDTLRDKMDHVGGDINKHIADVSQRVDALSDSVARLPAGLATQLDSMRKELVAETNAFRTDAFQNIDVLRGELYAVKSSVSSVQVWLMGMQLTIAGLLLGVMAHGFKWI
jgi:archaellum component FlaC